MKTQSKTVSLSSELYRQQQEHIANLERVLVDLMKVMPTPRAQKAKKPYQDALILASMIENRMDFVLPDTRCGDPS